jgi:hypothetical protein
MNSMANKTVLVALALTLWGTSSMAAAGELAPLPVSPAEQRDRHSVTAATAPVPLFALTRLDAQSLAAQAMTDQELKAVEGGDIVICPSCPGGPIVIPIIPVIKAR